MSAGVARVAARAKIESFRLPAREERHRFGGMSSVQFDLLLLHSYEHLLRRTHVRLRSPRFYDMVFKSGTCG